MSRTLDRELVTPAPGERPPGAGRSRRWWVVAWALPWLVVLATLGWTVADRGDVDVDGPTGASVGTIAFDTAVASQGGVRPLVADRAAELGTISELVVRPTPDTELERVFLLAPVGEDRPRLLVATDPGTADVVADGRFADGRPFETLQGDGPYVSLATVGPDGQPLSAMGRAMELAELVGLTADVVVGPEGVTRRPAGWVELGSSPLPPWHAGFATTYDFVDGRQLAITVEPARPGRQVLAAFGNTASIDLGTGEWAYRKLPPAAGFVFQRGAVVVDLGGDLSDTELLTVVHSLREMRPGEHPIDEAEWYPF